MIDVNIQFNKDTGAIELTGKNNDNVFGIGVGKKELDYNMLKQAYNGVVKAIEKEEQKDIDDIIKRRAGKC